MTIFWIVLGIVVLTIILSLFAAPSQSQDRNRPTGPRWYWFF